ncbi:EstC [Pseudonocardia sp. Ae168_Ps1]|uniref:alpha/beta fold hydrolase n=1 Tax=unclassified Pseudonocardia TaxID=2619320 RepID=UPI00094ADB46|nr:MULTISPECIES: alpha/beta hydrolase [unclassified Pseudonocardia]OLL76554.1 EstC [Pseudonocardia sp. Ae150A_Ps1]OLL82563.1 EstC [Pseudonocardia sp. Ae168_Ps1]OLL83322.1 EstC [Pseudonocardia sp. Ae263_Ps1]OLL90640.1 EstC [Pseudonocardia sp. Ae356_Ps1]
MTTGGPTVVLVHGAACNSSSWTGVVRELALRGVRTLAVDLPGHGPGARIPRGLLGGRDAALAATEPSGMAGVGTADDVASVAGVLRRAREHGPVVLVGISRGGLTLNAVANAHPELVDRLVYVTAHCPVAAGAGEYHASPENADSLLHDTAGLIVADPGVIGALRFDWGTADPALLDTLQAALLADGTRDELLTYLHAQDPDESVLIDDDLVRADAATWGTIPRHYVRLPADRALPVALQDRWIAEADALTPDNRFVVHDLGATHIGAQVHPGPLADVLEGITRLHNG